MHFTLLKGLSTPQPKAPLVFNGFIHRFVPKVMCSVDLVTIHETKNLYQEIRNELDKVDKQFRRIQTEHHLAEFSTNNNNDNEVHSKVTSGIVFILIVPPLTNTWLAGFAADARSPPGTSIFPNVYGPNNRSLAPAYAVQTP